MKHWILAAVLASTTSVWATLDWTKAQILKVDPQRAMVLLKHEHIESIGMEAMTMPFKVDEAVNLDTFKAGQNVRFTVAEKSNHFVVDQMEHAK